MNSISHSNWSRRRPWMSLDENNPVLLNRINLLIKLLYEMFPVFLLCMLIQMLVIDIFFFLNSTAIPWSKLKINYCAHMCQIPSVHQSLHILFQICIKLNKFTKHSNKNLSTCTYKLWVLVPNPDLLAKKIEISFHSNKNVPHRVA